MTSARTVRLRAPAKLNLTLEVLGGRPDGYHEVRTVLQAVELADRLELEEAEVVSLEEAPSGAVPVDGNLVLEAAELLRREVGVQAGARIRLTKRIPVSAGLGGGSSDAAATLLGLRRLWGLDLTEGHLLDIASRLGSDVPFFIRGGTAVGVGRGQELTPLPTPVGISAVIVAFSDEAGPRKTARLYALVTQDLHASDGSRTGEVARRIRSGEPLEGALFNVFDAVAPSAHPRFSSAAADLLAAGASEVHLTGTGPSLYALADERALAEGIRDRLAQGGHTVHVVDLLPAWGLEGLPG